MQATTCGVQWIGLCEQEPALRSWLARRCRDRNELDDVLQDTLLRAARFRGRLNDPAKLRGWLIRVAGNALRDRVRREGRVRSMVQEDSELDLLPAPECVRESPGGEAAVRLGTLVVTRDAARAQLAQALAALRADDRSILLEYYSGGTSCAQAALARGVTAETHKMRLFRARRRLTRALAARLAGVVAQERM